MRVLIIGGGLGGLTLAHGLRSAGIDVAVHERSARTGPQPASYGIHVNDHGNRALHACLPERNWRRYTETSVPAPNVIRFRDTDLEPLTTLHLSTPAEDADPITHRRAVRRQQLHQALLLGLDDVVRWDSTYRSHRTGPDGRIRVEFDDGTTDEGDVLVGADGSNSRVRHTYLPYLRRRELRVLTVAGRLPLTDPAARALPAGLTDGSVNNIVPGGTGWLFASTWPAAHDTDPRQPGTDADFLVWAYAAARDTYPSDVASLSAPQLRHLVLQRTQHWDPRLAAAIANSDPATIAPVSLRTMDPLPEWEPTTVTLLGDAIHNMTPMAGIGANTALRDADVLTRAIASDGNNSILDRIGRYEAEMRTYANEALALSTRNTRNAASNKRLPRIAFRTLLKASNAIPAVKHRVFPATAHDRRRAPHLDQR
ncbi:FAD-dependent oxidoreductase [Lentzea sp. JNUCC 0626]|uniref:FAD-dependent oxidoreductase n=1 Tax=Lentzea sp. JNUCC 0626 TaxID=3367513 RepID=UPI0037493EBD